MQVIAAEAFYNLRQRENMSVDWMSGQVIFPKPVLPPL